MGYTNCLYLHPWYQNTKKFGKTTLIAIAMATRWWDIPMMAWFPTLDSTDFTYAGRMKWIPANVKTVAFLRVPKKLSDPLIQGWFRGRPIWMQKMYFFEDFTSRNVPTKNMMNFLGILHARMSYTLVCSMVVQLLVVQYWLDTLMTLLGGGGWGGDWYKGGGWAPQQLIQGWWWVGWWC